MRKRREDREDVERDYNEFGIARNNRVYMLYTPLAKQRMRRVGKRE